MQNTDQYWIFTLQNLRPSLNLRESFFTDTYAAAYGVAISRVRLKLKPFSRCDVSFVYHCVPCRSCLRL